MPSKKPRSLDDELAAVYNAVFDRTAAKPTVEPGEAHRAGLRAVYEKGASGATRSEDD